MMSQWQNQILLARMGWAGLPNSSENIKVISKMKKKVIRRHEL